MSTAYAGNDTNFPTDITIPSDGDPKPAVSVTVGLEGVADRTAWLGRVVAKSALGSVIRPVSSLPRIVDISGTPSWTYNGGLKLTQVDIDAIGPTPNGFYEILQLPHGSTLQGVSAYLKGNAGHAVLPTLMPTFGVYKQRIDTGAAAAALVTGTDGSPNVAVFQAVHPIDATLSEVIDNSLNVYWVLFSGERDIATAVAGAEFYGFRTTCDVTILDPGAG